MGKDAWDDMTADQKADHLRRELKRAIEFMNVVSSRVGKPAERIDRIEGATAQTARPNSPKNP
jgi:hypothetical protein